MGWIRNFTNREGHDPPIRNLDDDAPAPMRQQLVDLWFSLIENNPDTQHQLREDDLYGICAQSLGIERSGKPYAVFRYAVGRDIRKADWKEIYNLICRLQADFSRVGLVEEYREGVNKILAAHGVAYDLGNDGRLHRVLPEPAQSQIEAAIAELTKPEFNAALELFKSAREAYDAIPRRSRDACANIFDALESVAKIVYGMPNKTFGDVLKEAKTRSDFNEVTISILEKLYRLANHTFRHGDIEKFNLSSGEVDFVYLTCIAGILLFARIRQGA